MSAMKPSRLLGTERFHLGAESATEHTVLEMWRWTASDLLSNTARGLLAEWLVALDLGVADGAREEWAPYDLRTREGVTVEVKSSAYVQAWAQARPTTPSFGIGPTRAWRAETGSYEAEVRRQAEVYVFALHAERERLKVDPLDLRQWEFFVLATRVLDERVPAQKRIALSSLLRLGPARVGFGGIAGAVAAAIRG